MKIKQKRNITYALLLLFSQVFLQRSYDIEAASRSHNMEKSFQDCATDDTRGQLLLPMPYQNDIENPNTIFTIDIQHGLEEKLQNERIKKLKALCAEENISDIIKLLQSIKDQPEAIKLCIVLPELKPFLKKIIQRCSSSIIDVIAHQKIELYNTFIHACQRNDTDLIETVIQSYLSNQIGFNLLLKSPYFNVDRFLEKKIQNYSEFKKSLSMNDFNFIENFLKTHQNNSLIFALIIKSKVINSLKVISTVLIASIREDKDSIIKIILDSKAHEVNTVNACEQTLLHLAALYDSSKITDLLLKLGADPNAQDINGNTPLHLAAHKNHALIADLLLTYNADINLKNKDGKTAQQMIASTPSCAEKRTHVSDSFNFYTLLFSFYGSTYMA